MESVFNITFLLTVCFCSFLLWSYFFWQTIPDERSDAFSSEQGLTVIIAARNEEKNILQCLNSLSGQNFPISATEILIVDDHSEEGTKNVVLEFISTHPGLNIRLIEMNEGAASKKAAISKAITESRNEIILMTDADCIVPQTWISTMLQFYIGKNALFLAGPVLMDHGNSLFSKVQCLEFMGLVGIAAAGISSKMPIMCNGANLMFSKKIFHELGGFDSTRTLASGDDTQLLLKVSEYDPKRVFFIKDQDAIVITQTASGTKEFIQQRKRWAGKIPFALTPFTITIAVISWLTHAFLLLSLLLSVFYSDPDFLFILSVLLLITCELLLLNSIAGFFKKRFLLWLFLPAQFFYWIYIVLIGAIAPLGSFQWKGRTFVRK